MKSSTIRLSYRLELLDEEMSKQYGLDSLYNRALNHLIGYINYNPYAIDSSLNLDEQQKLSCNRVINELAPNFKTVLDKLAIFRDTSNHIHRIQDLTLGYKFFDLKSRKFELTILATSMPMVLIDNIDSFVLLEGSEQSDGWRLIHTFSISNNLYISHIKA